MVASPPESEAIMPWRILRSREYQLAEEPESQVRMQLSGRRGESSQNTLCGLMGWADSMARASMVFHHWATCLSIRLRQARLSFLFNKGSRSFNVSALSPTRFTSMG